MAHREQHVRDSTALTPDGAFVTTEKGLPRLKRYTAAGEFDRVIAGPEAFSHKAVGLDVAVDSRGRVLVLDPGAGVVRVFDQAPASTAADQQEAQDDVQPRN